MPTWVRIPHPLPNLRFYIKIFKSTIGLGIIAIPNEEDQIVQFKTPREIKSRSFDRIVWIKEPSDELLEEAFYATIHSKYRKVEK